MSILLVLLLCSTISGPARPTRGAVTAAMPRPVHSGEAIRARITLGSLPRGARVVVRLPDGRIAGTLAPYGRTGDGKTAAQTIAIPSDATTNGKVHLQLDVQERGAASPRPATSSEVTAVELVLIPVTH
jgi:hypothetical protein